MQVTLIFTVLNEAASLPRLLDSLAVQSRPPDEIIVCDGGSRDATVAILRAEKRFAVRVIESPGANISRGRNLAIAQATREVIACTDAGVRLDPHWLEHLTCRFLTVDPSAIAVRPTWVGGFFLPDTHTPFEIAMGATVLPQVRDIRPDKFLPSSRSVAFLKSAWEQIGGYPEWLDYCEDLVFDFAMRRAFGQCAFAPDALVYFRPRPALRSFFRQYYLYARGDGKAGLWLKRHLVRYGTYLVGLPLILCGFGLAPGWLARLVFVALLLFGGWVYTRAPYRRLVETWGSLAVADKLRAVLLVPVIRVVGDVAKMIGYPAGVWWRLRHAR
jgi:glycosyltransferase involved in cell wall biosynthesis